MILELNGTKVTIVDKTLGYQGDNLVNTIQVTVDKDSTWNYKLDMYKGKSKCFDSVLMTRDGNVCTVELTDEILSYGGRYTFQLRGYTDTQTYHSEIFESWVNASIEYQCDCKQADCGCDCKLPTEFYQVEDNVTEINNHPPYPGDNGKWMIWDVGKHEYVESDIEVAGGGTLVVTFTGSSSNMTADHTIAEIWQAFQDGKNIIGVNYSNDLWKYFVYSLYTISASSATFTNAFGERDSYEGTRIGVTTLKGTAYDSGDYWQEKDNSIASNVFQKVSNLTTSITSSSTDTQYPSAKATYDFVNSSKEIMVVDITVTYGSTITVTSDTTYDEVKNAYDNGKQIILKDNTKYYHLIQWTNYRARFCHTGYAEEIPTRVRYDYNLIIDWEEDNSFEATEIYSQRKGNLVTTINQNSLDYTYPSTKAVYDYGKSIAQSAGKIDAITVNGTAQTVENKTAKIVVNKSTVGLGNVDNTADKDKPVSTAQATAIVDAKKAGTDAQANLTAHIEDKSNPHEVTKAQIGLENVDNTSDTNKPVSTAQAEAIADAKKAGTDAQTTITGHIANKANPHGVTKAQVGLGDVDNTSDANKPISTATQTALDKKLDKTAVVDVTASATKGQAADAKAVWDMIGNVKDLIDRI